MTKLRISYRYVVSTLVGVVTGGILMGAMVGAAPFSRYASGSLSKFDTAELASDQSSLDSDKTCTQSQVYEDVTNMSVEFTTTTDDSPSVVTFNTQSANAEVDTTIPEYTYIRLVVDGQVQSGISSEKMVESMYGYPESGWQFVTDNLNSGTHTAKLQWRIMPYPDGVSSFCIKDASMVVLHS
jgi:hypothetical protein